MAKNPENKAQNKQAIENVETNSKFKIKNWYSNRYQVVLIQRNILLLFTIISLFSVSIAVLFVKSIMTSKSLEPYIIQIDEKTGVPSVVKQMDNFNFTSDQAIRHYFINQFVQAASGYDPVNYKSDANKVRLFSTSPVYSDFRRRINARDLGGEASIQVRIKSIQFTDSNNAQIRILTEKSVGVNNVGSGATKNEVITMTFNFTDMNLTLEERMVNPLGFQVSKYLIAEETFNY